MASRIALLFLWHLATCLNSCVQAETIANDDRLIAPASPPSYNEAIDNGTFGYYPVHRYATTDELHSPQTNFLQYDEQCNDGRFTFITPRGWSLTDPGPMILDGNGDLIWTEHTENGFGGQAYDFMVQEYRGEPVLTFWLGDDRIRGHGSGWYYMLNSSYDLIRQVEAAGGLAADLHEFLITPEGTALMTMYQMLPHDVTEFRHFDPENPDDHDPNWMWDCLFQEVDIETGALVFEWRASDHVPLSDTYHGIGPGGTKTDPFDWFHINSIQKDELGNYLISARYTHSITYIDGRTGDIIWTLGGRNNDFMDLSDGYGLNFAWQHDARFVSADTFPNIYVPPAGKPGYTTTLLTMFDNAAEDQHYEYGLTYSRGLLLEITYPTPDVGSVPERSPRRQEASEEEEELAEELWQEYSEPVRNLAKLRAINGSNPHYTVRVIKSYENPRHIRSSSQGSLQVLPATHGERDSKVLVGYGLNAAWTEFAADGTVLCDVHYGAETSWERGDIQSYRTYKFPWVGRPEQPPSVEISDDDVEIYVSWNGATDVVDWILQCSDDGDGGEQSWADLIRVAKTGFETEIPIPDIVGDTRYMRVIALGESGRRLQYGISEVIDRGIVAVYFPVLNQHLPESLAHMSPLNVLLVLASMSSGMFILYEMYRRFLQWRHGGGAGSPLRWKQGYRLLGDGGMA